MSNGAVQVDSNFTEAVINATGPAALPRLKQVMPSLIQHMHDFCTENQITIDEFMAAVELVSSSFSGTATVASCCHGRTLIVAGFS